MATTLEQLRALVVDAGNRAKKRVERYEKYAKSPSPEKKLYLQGFQSQLKIEEIISGLSEISWMGDNQRLDTPRAVSLIKKIRKLLEDMAVRQFLSRHNFNFDNYVNRARVEADKLVEEARQIAQAARGNSNPSNRIPVSPGSTSSLGDVSTSVMKAKIIAERNAIRDQMRSDRNNRNNEHDDLDASGRAAASSRTPIGSPAGPAVSSTLSVERNHQRQNTSGDRQDRDAPGIGLKINEATAAPSSARQLSTEDTRAVIAANVAITRTAELFDGDSKRSADPALSGAGINLSRPSIPTVSRERKDDEDQRRTLRTVLEGQKPTPPSAIPTLRGRPLMHHRISQSSKALVNTRLQLKSLDVRVTEAKRIAEGAVDDAATAHRTALAAQRGAYQAEARANAVAHDLKIKGERLGFEISTAHSNSEVALGRANEAYSSAEGANSGVMDIRTLIRGMDLRVSNVEEEARRVEEVKRDIERATAVIRNLEPRMLSIRGVAVNAELLAKNAQAVAKQASKTAEDLTDAVNGVRGEVNRATSVATEAMGRADNAERIAHVVSRQLKNEIEEVNKRADDVVQNVRGVSNKLHTLATDVEQATHMATGAISMASEVKVRAEHDHERINRAVSDVEAVQRLAGRSAVEAGRAQAEAHSATDVANSASRDARDAHSKAEIVDARLVKFETRVGAQVDAVARDINHLKSVEDKRQAEHAALVTKLKAQEDVINIQKKTLDDMAATIARVQQDLAASQAADAKRDADIKTWLDQRATLEALAGQRAALIGPVGAALGGLAARRADLEALAAQQAPLLALAAQQPALAGMVPHALAFAALAPHYAALAAAVPNLPQLAAIAGHGANLNRISVLMTPAYTGRLTALVGTGVLRGELPKAVGEVLDQQFDVRFARMSTVGTSVQPPPGAPKGRWGV
jgi:archaellum component FlaC